MRRRLGLFVLLAAFCAVAAPAVAQIDQGRFTGTVTDAQGGVLPGVTVTARSPVADRRSNDRHGGDGKYSIASLPSGQYELTFELSGFQAFKRAGVILALGQILTVDGQLQVATLQESVTVTGASPVVDMQSTKVGTDFTTDKLVGVPTATDVWAVLGQASGVRMNGFDVGGSHKSQQTGYESFGIRNQNRVLNDGVDTTEGTGGAGFYADFFSNEEVAVSAAGGDVEMNSPGSAVVNTIKSGGNTFKMLNNLTYQQESLRGGQQQRRELSRARLHRPAEHQVLGRPHRHRRPDQDRQGLVLRRLQPLQDRQADLGRAAQHRHRPRRLRQLRDEGNLEGVAEGHGRRLLPVGPEAEAEPRPVGRPCRRRRRSRRTASPGSTRASTRASGPTACSRTSRSTCSATTSRSASRPTTRCSRRASTPARTSPAAPRGTRSTWPGRSRRSPRSRPTTCRQRWAATTSRSASSTCSTSPSTRSTAARARSSTAT